MIRYTTGVMILASIASVLAQEGDVAVVETADLRVEIDATGLVTSLYDNGRDRECLAQQQPAPVLQLTVGDAALAPTAATYDEETGRLSLSFGQAAVGAEIDVKAHETHVTLTLAAVTGDNVTRIQWGPFPTTVGDVVGETVGVVRGGGSALGVQALNVQTVGGAAQADFGSLLQAYAIEHDGGVVGSAIALFACPEDEALDRIGEIEVAEGLPHPMLDGVWAKLSPKATVAYMICPFGEQNMEQVLEKARQAGLTYVYHPGPFKTWGHFELNPGEFPDGDASLKRCCEAAAKVGIGVGVHTLTAFITTNDPYVTPVPDPRLARSGSSVLSGAVSADATEIAIDDAASFKERGTLGAAIIGQELVQYDAISEDEPWRLLGCKRGAFSTRASEHAAGDDIGKLADHGYRTLYPGIENGMMDELTDRLVELFNNTGLLQISFDGLEGLSTYGYGEYSRNRFVQQCVDGWEQDVISDASNLLHYLWHIHTRMNWGEPWGKAMREGMPEYRFRNQAFFERNLFPKMLGWFQLRLASGDVEATNLSDMEWVLSKAAGYGAGFAVSTSLGEMNANGQTPAILDAVREWEAARHAAAFSDEQRQRLREAQGEWHLEADGAGGWLLAPVRFVSFDYPPEQLQPGQPPTGEWQLDNPFGEQPASFVVYVPASDDPAATLEEPAISIGGREVRFSATLRPQQYLVCDGGREARVCDANWNELEVVTADGDLPALRGGANTMSLTTQAVGAVAKARLTFRLQGEPEAVKP